MSSAGQAGSGLICHFRWFFQLGTTFTLCASSAIPGLAQPGPSPRIGPTPAVVPFQLRAAPSEPGLRLADSLDLKPSYWKEGGLVGAGVLGLSMAILIPQFCQMDDSGGSDDCAGAAVWGAVLGGAMGFGLGALIGGMFPKPVPDSVTVAVPGAEAGPEPGWSAAQIAVTALLATGGAFLGADAAGALGAMGGIGLGVFLGSRLP